MEALEVAEPEARVKRAAAVVVAVLVFHPRGGSLGVSPRKWYFWQRSRAANSQIKWQVQRRWKVI